MIPGIDPQPSRTRRLLVVEDDAPVRDLIVQHLRRAGFDVDGVGNAEEALIGARRADTPYDLVLTDVHLPGISGVELARLLLAHAPLRPIIVITGDSDEALARNALRHGASGYLLKPFELFELDAVIGQAISRLELIEATGAMARAGAAARSADAGASIPPAWLGMADERSGAGNGHGYRVARIAGTLVATMPDLVDARERGALDLAARAHELGRLLGPVTDLAELAHRTARFLADLGLDEDVARIVRHAREAWDGSGGPEGLAGDQIPTPSLILAAADEVDHRTMSLAGSGTPGPDAAANAIRATLDRAGHAFGPRIADALDHARDAIEAICSLAVLPGAPR